MARQDDAFTFAGIAYDPQSSYTDRTGAVWFFEDTVSVEDGTQHMSSSADCYQNSLADVVVEWGPLTVHSVARSVNNGLEQLFRRLGTPPIDKEN